MMGAGLLKKEDWSYTIVREALHGLHRDGLVESASNGKSVHWRLSDTDANAVRTLKAELASLKAQLEQAQRERDEARAKFDNSEKARHWLIDRLNEEGARVGMQLHWTDGGGSACPGGFHRNPFFMMGDLRARLAKSEAGAAALLRSINVAIAIEESAECDDADVPPLMARELRGARDNASDAGRGYIGPEVVTKVREALDDAIEELRTDENYVGENGGEAEFLTKLRTALALLEGGK
jgi:hypothetical protein